MISLIKNPNMELLWENTDITAGFSSQTIALDLSGYKEVWILYRHYAYNSSSISESYVLSKQLKGYNIECVLASMLNISISRRDATISNTGVTFSEGKNYAADGTFKTDNLSAIPVKIYGIK